QYGQVTKISSLIRLRIADGGLRMDGRWRIDCGVRKSDPEIRNPPSAIRNGNRRSRRTVEHRVEQHPERAERLATPLRPEAEEHGVPVADANIERRRFAEQMLFS